MSTHRLLIRNTIIDLLKAGNTIAGKNVFAQRAFALNKDIFPALLVYTLGEDLDLEQVQDYGMRRRTLHIAIECCIAGYEQEDDMDRLTWDVETILYQAPNLNRLVESCLLTQWEYHGGAKGTTLALWATLYYDIIYCTHMAPSDEAVVVHSVRYSYEPDTGLSHRNDYQEAL
ncbi:hypothetical protein [Bartonella sp. DGB2]|uniref:hypothetical protein n=2 Tax=Bartonella sp. DGB2 TaxID=3388426 RepID=UPI0039901FA5